MRDPRTGGARPRRARKRGPFGALRRLGPGLAVLAAGALLLAAWAPGAQARPEKAADGIRFTYTDENAGSVSWAGAFNNWSTTANPMQKGEGGVWTITLPLGAGEHQYKFVVDGQWVADPENPATAGDYGNSVVSVGADGELIEVAATSNTPYSPKILFSGRGIGLYRSIRDPVDGRFQLYRPSMEMDLDLGIRISDFLRAHFLLNFTSSSEEVELYRSRLNFDRGSLDFVKPRFQLFAWDNESAGTWDDPLHLVGDVGIYGWGYGYGRQGFRLRGDYLGAKGELQYSDNFTPGSPNYGSLPTDILAQVVGSLPVVPSGSGGFDLIPGLRSYFASQTLSDANEDMLAARVNGKVWRELKLGLLGRLDRGYNFGSLAVAEATGPQTLRTVSGTFQQMWYAYGGEARYSFPFRLELFGEYLRGHEQVDVLSGTEIQYRVDAVDSAGVTAATAIDARITGAPSFDLDVSDRFRVGGRWREEHGDIEVRADVEYQDHVYELLRGNLDNSMVIYRLGWDRNWRYYLDREVKTKIDVEYTDFSYTPGTPWGYQLWYPTANFWLDNGPTNVGVVGYKVPGGSKVSVDRYTMLGGNDVVSIRPSLEVPLYEPRNATFEYAGIFNTVSLSKRPKYIESIFRLGCDINSALRVNTDSRWAKYDDPVLGMHGGYVSHFAELVYKFAPRIQVALSYGVDPWVVDRAVNEYRNIGRDQFLFDRGATADAAAGNYYGFGAVLSAAEKAMRDDRRFQVEAVIYF